MRENQRITASLKTAEYGLAYRLQSKRYNDIFQYPRAGSASTDSSGTWANRWFTSGFDSGGYGPNAAVKRCGVGCSRAFAKGSRLDSTQLLLCAYAPTSVGCGKGKNARISGANISYYRDKDYWGGENFRKDERKFSLPFLLYGKIILAERPHKGSIQIKRVSGSCTEQPHLYMCSFSMEINCAADRCRKL